VPDTNFIDFEDKYKGLALEVCHSKRMMADWEVLLLQVIVKSIKGTPSIVNLGAGAGTSGLAIVEARPDATVWTIDILDESPGLLGERQVFENTGLPLPIQIHGDCRIVGENWSYGDLDIVFVDDDHWGGTIHDIIQWQNRVKLHGYLIFHDVGLYGVQDAIDANLNMDMYDIHLHVGTVVVYRRKA
jgi:predicted O-methyltransferase YrrM